MYTYIRVHIYIYIYIYIHTYVVIVISHIMIKGWLSYEEFTRLAGTTPSPPTKSLGFGGFDSSRLLILRGGNSHVRMIL